MAKCIVLGCSKFTASLVEGILQSNNEILAIISMPKECRPNNSYDLENYAKKNNIKYEQFNNINDEKCRLFIEKLNPNFIISSWHKIIKDEILNLCPIIGTHPTNLPKDKGRHPLHWLLARGVKKSTLSFFKMDNSIDGGDIYLKLPYKISKKDDINTLNLKINKLAKTGIKKLLKSEFLLKKQRGKTNYLRARNIHDCIIDPRMGYKTIRRLIASFTAPYPCAKLIIENKILSIKKCKRISKKDEFGYGKIIKIKDKFIEFSCKNGILRGYFLYTLNANEISSLSRIPYIGGGYGEKFGLAANPEFLYTKAFFANLVKLVA